MWRAILRAFVAIAALSGSLVAAFSPATPVIASRTSESEGHWEEVYHAPGTALMAAGRKMLAVDAQGNLLAVYGAQGLRLARRVAGAWQSEVVDPAPANGDSPSVALDGAGVEHICYSGAQGELRHAWRSATGWSNEQITTANVGACSISVGRDGFLGVSYGVPDGLKFAYREASGWRVEAVPGASDVNESSLAIWDKTNIHMTYVSGGSLTYAYRDGTGWRAEVVLESAGPSAIALSSGGLPRIAWATSEGVFYATRGSAGWQIESVAPNTGAELISLITGPDDTPHLAFDGTYGDFAYARRGPAGWQTSLLDSEPCGHFKFSLTLVLMAGQPVIARQTACDYMFRSVGINVAFLASDGASVTSLESPAASRSMGLAHQLAVDARGFVHTIYSGDDQGLTYAYQNAAGWHSEIVAGAGATEALALDPDGRPRLAFVEDQRVVYGVREAGVWRFEPVHAGPASHPSILTQSDGLPAVAWVGQDGIMLGRPTGAGWITETVGSGDGNTALAENAGKLFVAYAEEDRLARVAYREGDRWFRAYPAPLAPRYDPFHVSLVSDGHGALAISNTVGGSYSLFSTIAIREGLSWTTEALDSTMLDSRVALAYAPDGTLAAAYAWSSGNGTEIVYAQRIAGLWQRQTVAMIIEHPFPDHFATSLAFDSSGRPYIGYYDDDTRGFRIVRWTAGPAPTPTPTKTPAPSVTPTATPTVTPTGGPGACNTTPTPAVRPTGTPPASGSIQRQVGHCVDDTYVRVDTEEQLYDLTYVRMGAREGGAIPYVSGFLFRNLNIPRGADILSARLRLQPEGRYSGGTVTVSIAGELHGQAGDFNPNNWWAHLRPRTVARVPWSLPAATSVTTDSPDISAVVEEIIALPDWQPGNNLAILIDATELSAQWLNWRAFDGQPAAAAQLILTYGVK